jgi:hypothetical protein
MLGSRIAAAAASIVLASSLASANPYCAADLDESYTLDVFDVFEFLDLFNASDPQADFTSDGSFDIFDVFAFLDEYNSCDLIDSDGDRIPNWAESDDGNAVSIFLTGTDPLNADTDGDGIDDGDEVLGTLDGLDLPSLGASALRKDIFVECDWFAGFIQGHNVNFRITPAGAQRLMDAFAFSGVENPYGLPSGISLHLDYGQGGAFTGGNQLPGTPEYVTFLGEDYWDYRDNNFDENRVGYFHYAMLANRYNSSSNGSSGVAQLSHDNMMVTLFSVNNDYNQTQTFMHELGHNLGLHHGGIEAKNYKPNYNSVLNYRHQFPGADGDGDTFGDGILDFSHGLNNSIDEQLINENLGVLGTPVDFNDDGFISAGLYERNINCGGATAPCWVDSGCWDDVCDVLEDNDDWSTINWARLEGVRDRDISAQREVIKCENTPPGAE